ncbi:hypothetical protein AB4Z42_08305 [Mycobacterium sp. 2YAF39]
MARFSNAQVQFQPERLQNGGVTPIDRKANPSNATGAKPEIAPHEGRPTS